MKGGRARSRPPSSRPRAERREGEEARGTGPLVGQARKGRRGAGQGERKRGPSGQNERGGFSSFYFIFFNFKALFKLISKAFEFVLNFDQNHTSQ